MPSFRSALSSPPVGTPLPPAEAQPAEAQAPPDPYALPSLDPNDPDFEEKNAIHQAFEQLGQKLQQANPNIDYVKEWEKMQQGAPERPERQTMNPLSQFAIAVGSGERGLNRVQATEDTRYGDAEKRWSEIMQIREEALKGDIQQKLEAGKFKQALLQSEALASLQAQLERMKKDRQYKHEKDIEEIRANSRRDVANIRAKDAQDRLTQRLTSLADNYKIEGEIRKEFFKSMFRAMAARMTQQDITKDPIIAEDDFAAVMGEAVDWAEKNSGVKLNAPPAPAPSAPSKGAPAAATSETPEQRALREIRERNKAR